MRKARRRHPLTATEQALYNELVAICNDVEWDDVFYCSNYELCSSLQVSEKTLIDARNSLIQVGLVTYKSGKSRRVHGNYSFTKKLTTVKFPVDVSAEPSVDSSVDKGVDVTVDSKANASDSIKKKTKMEIKTKQNSFSVPGKPDTGGKKTELPYWARLVDTWFIFYKEKFEQEPTFNGAMAAALKSISQRMKKLSGDKNFEWTEDYASRCLNHFLNKAYSDEWLRANFLLTNLSTKFDSIVNTSVDATKNSRQSTGANVSAGSILSKINAMRD